MQPPVFETAVAAAPVTALLGTSPTRLYGFGIAPPGAVLPYAVWQTIYGAPENRMGCAPDIDQFGVQVTAYGSTPAQARAVAKALRDAFEPVAYIVRWGVATDEPETDTNAYQFDVEFYTPR